MAKKNILIIGLPGVGKTTLTKRIVETLKGLRPVGFYTAEIREGQIRKGFELISLDGRKGQGDRIKLCQMKGFRLQPIQVIEGRRLRGRSSIIMKRSRSLIS